MSVKTVSRDRLYYGWVVVIAALIISAVLLGSRHTYGVFFKSIEGEFGLSRVVTSGIFSTYMVFSAVFSVLGGWSLDKFGPKWTIAMMGFFAALSLFLTSQMQSVWQLYLTYSFLLGMGTGETYTVVGAFVSRWFQKKRGLALGIANSGGGLGMLIMAPFASYLIINFDWRTAYIAIGLITLVIVIGVSMLLKGSPADIGLLPDGVTPGEAKIDVQTKKEFNPAGFSIAEAVKSSQFWFLFAIWLFHGTAIYLITTHIVPHATDVGISAIAAAAILSVFSGSNMLGGLAVGALSDSIGRKTMAIICALIGAGALFWLMWMTDNVWMFYIFAALFGIPFGGISTMVNALAGDIFGMCSLGRIMGCLGIAWFAGAAIGPLMGGTIYDTYHSYFFAFLIGAICMLMVILFLAILSKPRTS